MAKRKDRGSPEVNSSSMADIAFLLLVFFLVTTTIPNDKGLLIQLPPKTPPEDKPIVEQNERNVFAVRINSADKLLVDNEPLEDIYKLRSMAKEHILNPNNDPNKAVSPQEAIISLKNDRGTSYETFVTVLDQLQAAYYDIFAERVGLTATEYRNLDPTKPEQLELIKRGKGDLVMAISIAQPTKFGEQ